MSALERRATPCSYHAQKTRSSNKGAYERVRGLEVTTDARPRQGQSPPCTPMFHTRRRRGAKHSRALAAAGRLISREGRGGAGRQGPGEGGMAGVGKSWDRDCDQDGLAKWRHSTALLAPSHSA
jgi:hypothetical protein